MLLPIRRNDPGEHVSQINPHLIHPVLGEDIELWVNLFLSRDLDHPFFEVASEELLPQLGTCLFRTLHALGVTLCRHRQESVDNLVRNHVLSSVLHTQDLLFAHHVDCHVHKVTHHRLHVAAYVSHLGEFRRFNLGERARSEASQASRDLGLANTRRPDHEDVLRLDLLTDLVLHHLAAHPVTQGNRHAPLRLGLTDDVLIELRDDLTRR